MADPQRPLRDELRDKYGEPKGRARAVHLFCLECCGGERREANRCKTLDCFLWPWSLAARTAARKNAADSDTDELPPEDAE